MDEDSKDEEAFKEDDGALEEGERSRENAELHKDEEDKDAVFEEVDDKVIDDEEEDVEKSRGGVEVDGVGSKSVVIGRAKFGVAVEVVAVGAISTEEEDRDGDAKERDEDGDAKERDDDEDNDEGFKV